MDSIISKNKLSNDSLKTSQILNCFELDKKIDNLSMSMIEKIKGSFYIIENNSSVSDKSSESIETNNIPKKSLINLNHNIFRIISMKELNEIINNIPLKQYEELLKKIGEIKKVMNIGYPINLLKTKLNFKIPQILKDDKYSNINKKLYFDHKMSYEIHCTNINNMIMEVNILYQIIEPLQIFKENFIKYNENYKKNIPNISSNNKKEGIDLNKKKEEKKDNDIIEIQINSIEKINFIKLYSNINGQLLEYINLFINSIKDLRKSVEVLRKKMAECFSNFENYKPDINHLISLEKEIKIDMEIIFPIMDIDKIFNKNKKKLEEVNQTGLYPLEIIKYIYKENINLIHIFKNKIYIQNINNIKELDLSSNIIGNKGLEIISMINFKQLKKLNLNDNKITDIKSLEKSKFEKLEIINLGNNNLTDINKLEKLNFRELEELYLNHNSIKDINVLEKVKFKKLKKLELSDNNISDIKVLEKVHFKELKKLYLNINIISNIKVFEKVKFEKLETLKLNNQKLTDISVLGKVNFKGLKDLFLSNNSISDISILGKVSFEKLEILDLSENKIIDINILGKVNFKELKLLYLNNNYISDINILGKVNFEELTILDLGNNYISDINVLGKVNFKEIKLLNLTNNDISDIKVLEKVNFKELKKLFLDGNRILDINLLEKINSKLLL